MINVGSKALKALYHGAETVNKVYYGADLVWSSGSIPAGYTICKYIKASGHQYIKTEVILSLPFIIDITIQYARGTDKNGVFIGGGDRWGYNYVHMASNGTDIQARSFLPLVENRLLAFTYNSEIVNIIHKIDNSSAELFTPFRTAISSGEFNLQTKYPMYLFCYNRGGNTGEFFEGKMYNCKIDVANKAICNFIPVIDPSGKPCMYDTITQQPFYNQGYGEFGYELMDGTYVAPI